MNEFHIYLDEFIIYLRVQKRYSDHTVTAYTRDIEQFFTFLSGISSCSDVNSVSYNQIRSWIVDLATKKISNRSINRKITSIRSFYKHLQKQFVELINPCDRVLALKVPKRLPSVVKESEINKIREIVFCEEEEDYFQWRDYLIIELLYNTGIRRSELINLEWKDLNLNQGLMKVFGKGKKERLVPLNKDLVENLRVYLFWRNKIKNEGVNQIFLSDNYRQLYPKAVYNIVKKYLSLITTIDKRSPHILRHSFATHLTNRGAELNAVKELLGHSSLAATQVYTHNSIEKLKNIYKQAHPKGE